MTLRKHTKETTSTSTKSNTSRFCSTNKRNSADLMPTTSSHNLNVNNNIDINDCDSSSQSPIPTTTTKNQYDHNNDENNNNGDDDDDYEEDETNSLEEEYRSILKPKNRQRKKFAITTEPSDHSKPSTSAAAAAAAASKSCLTLSLPITTKLEIDKEISSIKLPITLESSSTTSLLSPLSGTEDQITSTKRPLKRKRNKYCHPFQRFFNKFKRAYLIDYNVTCNWTTRPLPIPLQLKGHDEHVITCLKFDGHRVISGSDDTTLNVWCTHTGKQLHRLSGHTGGVWASQLKDNIVVSGSTDRSVRVWNLETGECVHILTGHTSTVRCLALFNNIVVSGSRDSLLRVWDVVTGQCKQILRGHTAAVRCVCFDGNYVVNIILILYLFFYFIKYIFF
jgi:hypothetical protein